MIHIQILTRRHGITASFDNNKTKHMIGTEKYIELTKEEKLFTLERVLQLYIATVKSKSVVNRSPIKGWMCGDIVNVFWTHYDYFRPIEYGDIFCLFPELYVYCPDTTKEATEPWWPIYTHDLDFNLLPRIEVLSKAINDIKNKK